MLTEYELICNTLEWLGCQHYRNQAKDERAELAKKLYCETECVPSECYNCGFSDRAPLKQLLKGIES